MRTTDGKIGHVRQAVDVRREEVLLELDAVVVAPHAPDEQQRGSDPERGGAPRVQAAEQAVGDEPHEHDRERHEDEHLEARRSPAGPRGGSLPVDERDPGVEDG